MTLVHGPVFRACRDIDAQEPTRYNPCKVQPRSAIRNHMIKIVLELSDDLAERAREAGLLDEGRLEDLLREAIRRSAAQKLLAMTEPLPGAKGPVTEEEARALVEESIARVRSRR